MPFRQDPMIQIMKKMSKNCLLAAATHNFKTISEVLVVGFSNPSYGLIFFASILVLKQLFPVYFHILNTHEDNTYN